MSKLNLLTLGNGANGPPNQPIHRNLALSEMGRCGHRPMRVLRNTHYGYAVPSSVVRLIANQLLTSVLSLVTPYPTDGGK